MTSLHSSLSTDPCADRLGQQGCHVITPAFVALASSRQGPGIDRAAAHLAVETLTRLAPTSTTVELVQAFQVANQSILSTVGAAHDRTAAGAAVIALELHRHAVPRRVAVASVGGSGLYRRRERATWRVTGRGVERGSPALGVSGLVDIQVWELDVEHGDQFLVCSEAVATAIDDDTVAGISAREADIDAAASSIVAAAIAARAGNYVAVVAVTVR